MTTIPVDEGVVNLAQITSDYTIIFDGEDAILYE